jgi:hypothetical protein
MLYQLFSQFQRNQKSENIQHKKAENFVVLYSYVFKFWILLKLSIQLEEQKRYVTYKLTDLHPLHTTTNRTFAEPSKAQKIGATGYHAEQSSE